MDESYEGFKKMKIDKESIYNRAPFFRGIGAFLCIILGATYLEAGQYLQFILTGLLTTVVMLPGASIKKSLKLSKVYWIIILLVLLIIFSDAPA